MDLVEHLPATRWLYRRHDFRQVYASVLRDHFGVSADAARQVLANLAFQTLPIFKRPAGAADFALRQNASYPARGKTMIPLMLGRRQRISLSLNDLQGRQLSVTAKGEPDAGNHKMPLTVGNLPPGFYLYRLRTESSFASKRLVVE